ncbi:MAG: hypothetical protein VB082_02950, partial [Christensenella sp.]|nr:hypothetical protein [Christensenella sp.]
ARNILYTIMRGDAENRVLFVCAETVVKWEKRLAKGKKSQMLPGLTPPGAAENIRGGSTQNGTGMLYNKNNPNKITENGIDLGASAYNYHKGLNLAAAQQYAAGLPEGIRRTCASSFSAGAIRYCKKRDLL